MSNETKKELEKVMFQASPVQLKFAEIYLDCTKKQTLKDIAKEVGITYKAIWVWFQNPEFVKWINSKKDELLAKTLMPRYLAAIRRALAGDFSYSKLLFEIEKEYTPAISHNVSIKVTEMVIEHVIQAIDRCIDDEDLKIKIGEELLKINLN